MGLHRGRRKKLTKSLFCVDEHAACKSPSQVTALLLGIMVVLGAAATPTKASDGLVASASTKIQTDFPSRSVDIDVSMADLHLVVGILHKQTGAEILIQEGDKAFPRVSVFERDAPLEKVLRNIAISANANVRRNSDGTYVISPKDGSAIPDGGSGVFYGDTRSQSHDTSSLHWRPLVLHHTNPVHILEIMHWDQYVRFEDRPTPIDNTVKQPILTSSPPILNLGTTNQATTNSVYPSIPYGHGITGNDAANRSVNSDSPDQAQQFPGGRGGQPFPGGGGPGGFNGGGQPGGNGTTGTGNLPDGVDRIYALQENNSLFVLATPEGYARLKDIVKNLDIAPRQVQIKVEFVRADVADVDAAAIDFSLVPAPGVGVASPPATSSGPGLTAFSLFKGNLAARLFVNLSHGRTKIVQAPLVTTTNNTTATLTLSTQIPYSTQTVVAGTGNANNIVTSQQSILTIPTTLNVTPRINDNDTITMIVNPTISSTGTVTPGSIPTVNTQSVNALRTIKNGETMVVGGFISKSEIRSTTRFPILSEIPILGNLFRSKDNNIEDSELLIFITATIIEDVGDTPASTDVTP